MNGTIHVITLVAAWLIVALIYVFAVLPCWRDMRRTMREREAALRAESEREQCRQQVRTRLRERGILMAWWNRS